jgi:uncharacterized protein (DUF1684 family)
MERRIDPMMMMMMTTTETGARDASAAWLQWRLRRQAELTGERGALSLIRAAWFAPGEGSSVDELRTTLPPGVMIDLRERVDAETRLPQHGYVVWDARSERRRSYRGTSAFPYDPGWRRTAELSRVDPSRVVPVLRRRGDTHPMAASHELITWIGGRRYALTGFDDGESVLVVFGDPTNRSNETSEATYPAGRFLDVPLPVAGRREAGTTVVLDFNRAYLPPCAYSDEYNCPLPPAANRLQFPVRAGERLVRRTRV